jgi:hypothetical protein
MLQDCRLRVRYVAALPTVCGAWEKDKQKRVDTIFLHKKAKASPVFTEVATILRMRHDDFVHSLLRA